MKGAILGDVIGSRFEWRNYKGTDFTLFNAKSKFTDDSVLTIAIAAAILNKTTYEQEVKDFANAYPNAGYGGNFKKWMNGELTGPYNSWGNGSAMRVSPIAYAFETEAEVLAEAEASAVITHNHPEGIKGAQALAMAIFLARKGASKEELKNRIQLDFAYDLERTCDQIRPNYKFDVSCQGSVPEAIIAFLESENVEDAIRLAVSLGGDSDTIASMAGALAEAFYGGLPQVLEEEALKHLDKKLLKVLLAFIAKYS